GISSQRPGSTIDRNTYQERFYLLLGKTTPIVESLYPYQFTIGDITFNCNEQYYMYRKAMYVEDYDLARDILGTDEPLMQLQIGKRVRISNNDDWNKRLFKCIMDGLMSNLNRTRNYVRS
ncbi:hypothetical protein LSH36_6g05027, partial [Paralvinella palmiformis]